MNGKTRDGLWIVVGAYLAYTGGQLIMDVLREKPEGYIGFVVAGVLFVAFGIGLVIYAIRDLTKPVEETEADQEEDEEEEADAEEGAKEQDSPAAEDREGQEEKGEGDADRDRV